MTPSVVFRAWRGSRGNLPLHLLSIFSVAVAYVCLGAALLLGYNAAQLQKHWASAGRATVYLTPEVKDERVEKVIAALQLIPEIESVSYISSDAARTELLAETHDELLEAVPLDGFPSSIELRFSADSDDAKLKLLLEKIKLVQGVDTIETYQAWTERLEDILHSGVVAAIILSVVVALAVVSAVGSTLRLSMNRRRDEMEVLYLIGATERYVAEPFILEGAAQGGLGALVALLILGLSSVLISSQWTGAFAQIFGGVATFLPFSWLFLFVASGIIMGALTGMVTVRRYLKVA